MYATHLLVSVPSFSPSYTLPSFFALTDFLLEPSPPSFFYQACPDVPYKVRENMGISESTLLNSPHRTEIISSAEIVLSTFHCLESLPHYAQHKLKLFHDTWLFDSRDNPVGRFLGAKGRERYIATNCRTEETFRVRRRGETVVGAG